eukprot:TRINITY_DN7028_c0_g1_i1.p1 TRINITY_DN7028_c0_g1~~TRINITY_DN7028_c0_g1_i1.p1  ORF type:complete len:248 (-),score=50.80 TRINITY_DN7028_c0_g1_i1:241-984(-)
MSDQAKSTPCPIPSSPSMSPVPSPSSSPLSTSPDLPFGVVSGLWVPFHLPEVKLSKKKIFGKHLNVIELDNKEYLIGRELAALLNRETFNMYRTMKVKRIEIRRANPEQVEYFAKVGAVRTGTHSVTLIPLTDGVRFVEEALERQMKNTDKKKKCPLGTPYGSPSCSSPLSIGSPTSSPHRSPVGSPSDNPFVGSPYGGNLGALVSAFEESSLEDENEMEDSYSDAGSPVTDPLRALYLVASETLTY